MHVPVPPEEDPGGGVQTGKLAGKLLGASPNCTWTSKPSGSPIPTRGHPAFKRRSTKIQSSFQGPDQAQNILYRPACVTSLHLTLRQIPDEIAGFPRRLCQRAQALSSDHRRQFSVLRMVAQVGTEHMTLQTSVKALPQIDTKKKKKIFNKLN